MGRKAVVGVRRVVGVSAPVLVSFGLEKEREREKKRSGKKL